MRRYGRSVGRAAADREGPFAAFRGSDLAYARDDGMPFPGWTPPLLNDDEARAYADAAASLVGDDKVRRDAPPGMGSEDFSFMAERVPAAYILVGQGDESGPAHSPTYNYNDAATPYGAAVYARAVEQALQREAL